MISWLADLWRTWRNQPFEWDADFPDSDACTDRIPLDADCPDTQPSQPGALDDLSDVPRWRVPVILFAFLLSGCATIPGLQISDEEREACKEHGCSVWTQAELEDLVRAAMIKGIEAARRQRGSI